MSYTQANRVAVLMLAMDIDAEIERSSRRRHQVLVPAGQFERAKELLADEFPHGVPRRQTHARGSEGGRVAAYGEAAERWFGPGSSVVFAIIVLCSAIHFSLHGLGDDASRSQMIRAGASAYNLIAAGEYWRLLTAVFLHFNAGHLLSNMATLLIVGPPLARLLGRLRFLGLFLATGVLANIASHLFNPVGGIKAGASGAIAGVLGALGGLALADRARSKAASAAASSAFHDDSQLEHEALVDDDPFDQDMAEFDSHSSFYGEAHLADDADFDEERRPESPILFGSRRSAAAPWQVIGAMAACYAMLIGFGPGRDNVAHVAGIVSGIILGRLVKAPASAIAALALLLLAAGGARAEQPAHAPPQPGTVVEHANSDRYSQYFGPSIKWALARGLRMEVVETRPIPLEPARLQATQKYYAQVTLAADKSHAENYVAGLPFPLVDASDPDAAIKLMLNYEARIVVDDLDVRRFECDTGSLSPDRGMSVERHFQMGHFRRLYYVSRLYHDPMPTWKTRDGVRYREVMHPIIQPFDLKGVGLTYTRYLDPYRQDDSWLYYPLLKRVRRLSSAQRSDALFGQDADIDSYAGYAGNPAWMDWRLLGSRDILGAMHTRNFPGRWMQGPADFMFEDTWEMRRVYVIEGRSRLPDYAYQSRIIYLDHESFVIPYTEMYDRKGQLWKAWVNQFKLGRKPFPQARRVVYDYEQQFLPALTIFDMQLEHATRCLLPSPAFPGEEGWYFNFGDAEGTTEEPFLISNIISSGR